MAPAAPDPWGQVTACGSPVQTTDTSGQAVQAPVPQHHRPLPHRLPAAGRLGRHEALRHARSRAQRQRCRHQEGERGGIGGGAAAPPPPAAAAAASTACLIACGPSGLSCRSELIPPRRVVSQAYRRLAKKLHPDKGGDPAAFGRLQAAFEVVGNPRSRQVYDTWAKDLQFRWVLCFARISGHILGTI